MATPTRLIVLAGSLQEILEQKRYVLGHLATMAAAEALEAGLEPAPYSPGMVLEAQRIAHLGEVAELIEQLAPYEEQARALAAHRPLAALEIYDPLCPADGALDDVEVAVRASVHMDMGPNIRIDIRNGGYTRFIEIARSEILGKKRKPLVTNT